MPEPQPLEYARPREPDPSRPRHPVPVMLLLLLCVLAFFATGVVGLLFGDVLGLAAAAVMIAGALFMFITVFGFLSRSPPAFVAAAIMTVGTLIAAALATLLTHGAVGAIEQQIRSTRTPGVGGIVVIDARSDLGSDLVAAQTARTLSAVAAGLTFCLLVYLAVQSFSVSRGIERRL